MSFDLVQHKTSVLYFITRLTRSLIRISQSSIFIIVSGLWQTALDLIHKSFILIRCHGESGTCSDCIAWPSGDGEDLIKGLNWRLGEQTHGHFKTCQFKIPYVLSRSYGYFCCLCLSSCCVCGESDSHFAAAKNTSSINCCAK